MDIFWALERWRCIEAFSKMPSWFDRTTAVISGSGSSRNVTFYCACSPTKKKQLSVWIGKAKLKSGDLVE